MNVNSLLKMSTIRRFNKDAPIMIAGALSEDEMLVLIQGEAGIFKDYGGPGQEQVETLGPGDILGETRLFLSAPPAQTAVATAPVIAVGINRQNVYEFFATQPEMTFVVMSKLCQKIEAIHGEHQKMIADVRAGVATRKLQEAEAKASRSCILFPDGHGSYSLPINNALEEYLYEDAVTCPLCGHTFKQLCVITSRLRRDGDSDRDMRIRYKDIEPMFYEIVSCPSCLFSAEKTPFTEAGKRLAERVNEEVGRFRTELYLKVGYERDVFTVFAGFYLAILCAPFLHEKYQYEQAVLWQKLSRLYADAQDEEMSRHAAEKSLEKYLYAYGHIRFGPKQEQQLCYIIGDLQQRVGDLNEARQFFYNAKINKEGTPLIARQADMRLDEIKELLKKQKEEGAEG
ncbi:MAG: DUF2225 domain-containing protein [Oscillospiraceae bacterium]|nr:DUF2225 domain-containing protein [Oscillospiraceae bacterium]